MRGRRAAKGGYNVGCGNLEDVYTKKMGGGGVGGGGGILGRGMGYCLGGIHCGIQVSVVLSK